jgi:hypothetical protein
LCQGGLKQIQRGLCCRNVQTGGGANNSLSLPRLIAGVGNDDLWHSVPGKSMCCSGPAMVDGGRDGGQDMWEIDTHKDPALSRQAIPRARMGTAPNRAAAWAAEMKKLGSWLNVVPNVINIQGFS